MTDLTFCHLHMTNRDMLIFETFENPSSYLSGELSDEELEIPAHEVPPNPDDSDILPSQIHPSYPYGNPTNVKHPANRPRKPTDQSSRALFTDLTYAAGGTNGALRWNDLALDLLLPVDREREEAEKAALERKMANGVNHGPGSQPRPQPAEPGQQTEGSEEDDDEDDDESDEISGISNEEDEEDNENLDASYDED